MLRVFGLAVCVTLTLSGCARISNSRFNPMNWFGSSREVVETSPTGALPDLVPTRGAIAIVDGRSLVAAVNALEVTRTSSGAIIRATGTAPQQGYFNAELVLVGIEGSTATYEFRVEAPQQAVVGQQVITVAKALSTAELSGIRTIVVRGAQNARSTTR